MKRWVARLAKNKSENPSSHEPLDSFTELPFACDYSGEVAVPNRQKILRQLHSNCQRQLSILQQALELSTAVILWSGPTSGQLSVYAFSSILNHLETGPFQAGVGITGVLNHHAELILAPVSSHAPSIPYHENNDKIGSFAAIKLQLPSTAGWQQGDVALLCVDRTSTETWGSHQLQLVREVAEQLTSEIATARQLFVYDRERHAYRRAFDGLRKLNVALGLESTFTATAEAIKTIVPADFISISTTVRLKNNATM